MAETFSETHTKAETQALNNRKRHIHLDWNGLSQVEWEELLAQAAAPPLQQSWAYGAALVERGAKVRRIVACDGEQPVALAQVIVRSWCGLFRLVILMRGPVWLRDMSEAEKREILSLIRALYPRRGRYFFIATPEECVPGLALGLEEEGFRRVITGYSTIMVPLDKSPDRLRAGLYGKWRNQLRKAEKAGLEVSFGGYDHPLTGWLLSLEKRQQTEKNYRGLPVSLLHSFLRHNLKKSNVITAFVYEAEDRDAAGATTAARAPDGRPPLAAAIFLGHGRGATYHIGWNSKQGRKCHALNLLLWESLLYLREAGFQNLDLGGVNTADSPDLARFKLGLGGDVKRLIGSYM